MYSNNGPKGPAAAVTDRTLWRVSGNLNGLENVTDANINTYAVSEYDYRNAMVNIDLGQVCMFNMLIIDHGPSKRDGFCRRVMVLVSNNGRKFRKVHSVPGTRRFTLINFITPALARYVRIQAVVPGQEPWSIAEVYLK